MDVKSPYEIRQRIETLLNEAAVARDQIVRNELTYESHAMDNYQQLVTEAKLWIKYYAALK